MTSTRLLVNQKNIKNTQVEVLASADLEAGQIRLHVDRVGFSVNNISYATGGESLEYWGFFPAQSPWGCVPAWGFGIVSESLCPDVQVGERVWGFLPLASELVLEPSNNSAFGFTDAMAHRKALPHIYNAYTRCAKDPLHIQGQEDVEALMRTLFVSGWLVDDFLEDNEFFSADHIIMSSASCKTAYCAAAQLARRKGLKLTGLTSRRNLEFVKSLGVYSEVLAYDDLAALDTHSRCVYLDFAGDLNLRARLHTSLLQLTYSCVIGASHRDKVGHPTRLPGPKPKFLFVPSQAAKRVEQKGIASILESMARDWHAFAARVTEADNPWLVVHHHAGATAAQAAYDTVLQGRDDPRIGHVLAF